MRYVINGSIQLSELELYLAEIALALLTSLQLGHAQVACCRHSSDRAGWGSRRHPAQDKGVCRQKHWL